MMMMMMNLLLLLFVIGYDFVSSLIDVLTCSGLL